MKKSTMYHAIRISALYFYVIICIAFIVTILGLRHDKGYYTTVRTMRAAVEQERISTGIRNANILKTSILSVDRPKTVEEFIPSTFGELQLTWPNGKRMDDFNRKEHLQIPTFFTKFFSNAFGFLSESELNTSPILLMDKQINYTRLAVFYLLRGKSGADYHLLGNQAIIPTDRWKPYYITLSSMIEDLNRREGLVPRVVIISYNVVTANTLRLSAVDLVVEYLPSGECSAILHVASSKVMNSQTQSLFVWRIIIIILAMTHLAVSVVDISTMGFANYITHWYGITKVALSATGLLLTTTTFWCFFPKYTTMDKLFNLPADKYLDVHALLDCELVDSCTLSLFLLVLCVDFAVAIKDAMGLMVISAVSTKGVRLSLAMLLIIMIYGKAAASSTYVVSISYSFMIGFFSKTIFPLALKDRTSQLFLIIGITILCIFFKFCLAIYIYNFEVYDGNYVSDYHPGRSAAVLSNLKPLRDSSKVKMQYIKKHSVYVGKPFEIQSSAKPEESKPPKSKLSGQSKVSKASPSKDSMSKGSEKGKLEARHSKLAQKWFWWQ